MAYEFKKHRGVAAVVLLIASVIAAILVLHIVFVLLDSNGSNTIVSTVADWSGHLAAWFKGLFTTGSPRWNAVLDYGLAALCYLFAGRLVAEFIERA